MWCQGLLFCIRVLASLPLSTRESVPLQSCHTISIWSAHSWFWISKTLDFVLKALLIFLCLASGIFASYKIATSLAIWFLYLKTSCGCWFLLPIIIIHKEWMVNSDLLDCWVTSYKWYFVLSETTFHRISKWKLFQGDISLDISL